MSFDGEPGRYDRILRIAHNYIEAQIVVSVSDDGTIEDPDPPRTVADALSLGLVMELLAMFDRGEL